MSVSYKLNKSIKVKDLKDKGFTVLTDKDAGAYQLVVESKTYYTDENGKGSWVGTYDKLPNNIDEAEVDVFEGHTGFAVIYEICDIFNAKFVTDTYIDDKMMESQGNTIEITEKDYDECMNRYKN